MDIGDYCSVVLMFIGAYAFKFFPIFLILLFGLFASCRAIIEIYVFGNTMAFWDIVIEDLISLFKNISLIAKF